MVIGAAHAALEATVYGKTFEGETFAVGIEKDRSRENVCGSSISQ